MVSTVIAVFMTSIGHFLVLKIRVEVQDSTEESCSFLSLVRSVGGSGLAGSPLDVRKTRLIFRVEIYLFC